MALKALLAATLVLATLWSLQDAQGNFAASPGFSGRAGFTCIACHTEAPLVTVPASAHLEGAPAAWEPGQRYTLTLRVEGGPPAMPAPQPQGGFDLAISAGRLDRVAGTQSTIRLVGTDEATYYPDGTLMRAWQVQWTAPGLDVPPVPTRFWLAVMAANGNHVIALNASDGGERFDSTASLTLDVPPSAAAIAAWQALPLALPTASAQRDPAAAGTWRVEGNHGDANATAIAWSVDGGAWQRKDAPAAWRLELALDANGHDLVVRSEGADRVSPPLALHLAGSAATGTPSTDAKASPLPAAPALGGLLLTLAYLLRSHRP